jgi:hypothetical protein
VLLRRTPLSEVQHSPGPEGTGPPAGYSHSEGYYVSYVQIDRLVDFYIRNAIAQEGGAGELLRIHLPRTPVNKGKRKRLRYILSTQLLPKDIQRQELAGGVLL